MIELIGTVKQFGNTIEHHIYSDGKVIIGSNQQTNGRYSYYYIRSLDGLSIEFSWDDPQCHRVWKSWTGNKFNPDDMRFVNNVKTLYTSYVIEKALLCP